MFYGCLGPKMLRMWPVLVCVCVCLVCIQCTLCSPNWIVTFLSIQLLEYPSDPTAYTVIQWLYACMVGSLPVLRLLQCAGVVEKRDRKNSSKVAIKRRSYCSISFFSFFWIFALHFCLFCWCFFPPDRRRTFQHTILSVWICGVFVCFVNL